MKTINYTGLYTIYLIVLIIFSLIYVQFPNETIKVMIVSSSSIIGIILFINGVFK